MFFSRGVISLAFGFLQVSSSETVTEGGQRLIPHMGENELN